MVLVGLLILASCEDVLEENPKQIVVENFYTNAADVASAVNSRD